jgi:hypothetical protein
VQAVRLGVELLLGMWLLEETPMLFIPSRGVDEWLSWIMAMLAVVEAPGNEGSRRGLWLSVELLVGS